MSKIRVIEIQDASEKVRSSLDSLIGTLKVRPLKVSRVREIFREYEGGISEEVNLSQLLAHMREE